MDRPSALLEVSGATVRLGGHLALDGVDFRLFTGEVHSLMGENGAGKSTLVKAITGALQLDAGTIRLGRETVDFDSPLAAQRAGISTVYQEIELLPNVSVAENIALGREPRRFGLIDWREMRRSAAGVLDELGLDVDPGSLLGTHPVAVQQLVAIARAIATNLQVLVLDEPTSSLDVDEVAELFRVMRELKRRGVAILFVSHVLEQVYEVCDRITVLRDGRLVGEYRTNELLRVDLVEKMLGREPAAHRAAVTFEAQGDGDERPITLRTRGLTVAPGIADADLDLGAGEVLGLAGLLGSGRTELARGLTGVDRLQSGVVVVEERTAHLSSPRRAMSLGVVYSSENRRTEGIVDDLTVQENIMLALQAQRGVLRRIGRARQRELAASWIEALDIRPAAPDALAGTLSGGNQQKVLLARLLAVSPRVLVLDEPTRGIDVGAKVEVQNLVADLADNGLSVIFISAELEEVLRVCDRVVVLRDGRIVDTVLPSDVTVDQLLAIAARPAPTQAGSPDG